MRKVITEKKAAVRRFDIERVIQRATPHCDVPEAGILGVVWAFEVAWVVGIVGVAGLVGLVWAFEVVGVVWVFELVRVVGLVLVAGITVITAVVWVLTTYIYNHNIHLYNYIIIWIIYTQSANSTYIPGHLILVDETMRIIEDGFKVRFALSV